MTMRRYEWDNFKIGDVKVFSHCYKQAVVFSFDRFVKNRCLDWQIELTTDPPKPRSDVRCATIWARRIEPDGIEVNVNGPEMGGLDFSFKEISPGVSLGARVNEAIDVPALKRRTGMDLRLPIDGARKNQMSYRPRYVDIADVPIMDRMEIFERWQHRVRETRNGYELSDVGQFYVVSKSYTLLRDEILQTCLRRDLVWRWELRRIQNPNDKNDRTACFLVTRMR